MHSGPWAGQLQGRRQARWRIGGHGCVCGGFRSSGGRPEHTHLNIYIYLHSDTLTHSFMLKAPLDAFSSHPTPSSLHLCPFPSIQYFSPTEVTPAHILNIFMMCIISIIQRKHFPQGTVTLILVQSYSSAHLFLVFLGSLSCRCRRHSEFCQPFGNFETSFLSYSKDRR